MKTFSQFLYEGLYIDPDNNLSYSDQSVTGQQEWIPVRDGQFRNADGTYRTKGKLKGFPFFFAYGMETLAPENILSGLEKEIYDDFSETEKLAYVTDVRKQFIDAFKHSDGNNKVIVQDLIEKSRHRFFSYLRDEHRLSRVDYIITLPSSSSLNKSIASILSEWMPTAKVLDYHLIKNVASKVVVSDKFPHRKGAEKLKPVLAKLSARLKKLEGPFKLTGDGGISSLHRDYVSEFIISDKDLSEIKGKTVLLVDDTVSVGTSLLDAKREVDKFEPSKVLGYVFFNEKRSGWR